MMSMEDAVPCVLAQAVPMPVEQLPLTEARGRVVADDVPASEPFPPFPASVKVCTCGPLLSIANSSSTRTLTEMSCCEPRMAMPSAHKIAPATCLWLGR